MPTIDLTDDQLAAVTAAIRRIIATTDIRTPHALTRCARRWRGSTRPQSEPRRPRRQPKPTSGRGDNHSDVILRLMAQSAN
jgi:hypothetical protein